VCKLQSTLEIIRGLLLVVLIKCCSFLFTVISNDLVLKETDRRVSAACNGGGGTFAVAPMVT
jgi:hypothetical protein